MKKKNQNQIENNQNENKNILIWSIDESEIRTSCSKILVAMTEIYLTDLCFDERAEEKCLEYLSMASTIDPTDPEPLQTLASVRLSQSEKNLAIEALLLSWSLWKVDKNKISIKRKNLENNELDTKKKNIIINQEEEKEIKEEEGKKSDENMELIIDDSTMIIEEEEEEIKENKLPTISIRINWIKLAIECELWNFAIEVLQQCELEDDQDGEIQYLLVISWFFLGQSRSIDCNNQNHSPVVSSFNNNNNNDTFLNCCIHVGDGLSRIECWLEAQESIKSCFQLYKKLGEINSGIDQSILNHLNEIQIELNKFGLIPINFDDDIKEDDDEDEENFNDDVDCWVDASDVEMA